MEYFRVITQNDLKKLVASTKKSLFLCLPSIHKELADEICYLDYANSIDLKEIEINILLDFDPQTFRQGYGDCGEVVNLIKGGFDVKSLKDNRISFIISDDIGYYLFIESRSLVPAEKETINAVKIDPVSIVRLKHFYFKDMEQEDFQDELANAIIEESQLLKDPSNLFASQSVIIEEISDKRINIVKKDIENNPPIHPDYKRTIDYYTNKFQYAELHFQGQNFKHLSVNIPSELLPYRNVELRKKLLTKLKLFQDIAGNESFEAFEKIIDKKKNISNKYLTAVNCRRGRSVLSLSMKLSFKKEVQNLSDELEKIKSGLYLTMRDEIDFARNGLLETLALFFIDNPTEDMIGMNKNDYPEIAKNIAHNLVFRLRIPDPSKWIKGFSIETNYSDITFEDLKDKKLLEEFKSKGIIKDEDESWLAVFGKAIKIKE